MNRKIELSDPAGDQDFIEPVIGECLRETGMPATKITSGGKIRLAIPKGISDDTFQRWDLRLCHGAEG
jgi:hypothetical protein